MVVTRTGNMSLLHQEKLGLVMGLKQQLPLVVLGLFGTRLLDNLS